MSTARGYRADALRPGSRARPLARAARSLGDGVWLGRPLARGAHFIYGVQRGRVSWVGVLAGSSAGPRPTLRHVRALLTGARLGVS
jgi:hypothetical protein